MADRPTIEHLNAMQDALFEYLNAVDNSRRTVLMEMRTCLENAGVPLRRYSELEEKETRAGLSQVEKKERRKVWSKGKQSLVRFVNAVKGECRDLDDRMKRARKVIYRSDVDMPVLLRRAALRFGRSPYLLVERRCGLGSGWRKVLEAIDGPPKFPTIVSRRMRPGEGSGPTRVEGKESCCESVLYYLTNWVNRRLRLEVLRPFEGKNGTYIYFAAQIEILETCCAQLEDALWLDVQNTKDDIAIECDEARGLTSATVEASTKAKKSDEDVHQQISNNLIRLSKVERAIYELLKSAHPDLLTGPEIKEQLAKKFDGADDAIDHALKRLKKTGIVENRPRVGYGLMNYTPSSPHH